VVEWRHAGTEEERGIAKWREHLRGIQHKKEDDEASSETASDTYDLPCGMSLIRRWAIFKFIPFCPTFLVDVKREQTTNDDDIEGAGVTVKMKALEWRDQSLVTEGHRFRVAVYVTSAECLLSCSFEGRLASSHRTSGNLQLTLHSPRILVNWTGT